MVAIIGIDPGGSGGIAFLSENCTPYAIKTPETYRDLCDAIEPYKGPHTVIVLEKVGATPKMGSSAAFKFGQSFGAIHMAAVALRMKLHLVTPQKWQKEFGLIVKGRGLGQGDTEKKNRNKARAQELFPGLKITHAIADALLIAEYGRRILITPLPEGA